MSDLPDRIAQLRRVEHFRRLAEADARAIVTIAAPYAMMVTDVSNTQYARYLE